jgi:rhamnogalacturonyl hydrolase YesR
MHRGISMALARSMAPSLRLLAAMSAAVVLTACADVGNSAHSRSGSAANAHTTAETHAKGETQPPTEVPRDPEADPLPLMEAVADWQLAQLRNPTAYPANFNRSTWEPRGWIEAAFFAGLSDLAGRSASPRFANAVVEHGASQNWRLGDRLLHADDQAIGQSYVWAYRRAHDPAMLQPMRANFDQILANPPHVSLDFDVETPGGGRACQARWCWSDALFMAPPAWTGLSAAVNDPRYLAYADSEFWATTDYLYDREEHLYYRDGRFLRQRDESGRKIFWSRGNGWVVGGIVRVLETLPANHPSRPRYEALLRDMAAKLITVQSASGHWPVSLLAGDRYQVPETSGTAFFVYGLAWGVNHGLLDRAVYGPAVERGWAALVRAVKPDGKLGWVQQVGYAPDQVTADDTQLYGVGAFLLAGGQVRDLRNHR